MVLHGVVSNEIGICVLFELCTFVCIASLYFELTM